MIPDVPDRHPRRPLRAVVGTLVVLVVFLSTVIAAGPRASSLIGMSATQASPTVHLVAHSLDDMETVGRADFPNVYVGGVREADGSVTFYVAKRDPVLMATIAAADSGGTPYKIVIVQHSYASMNNLTMAIAHQARVLIEADGVRLVDWGPDPTTSMVVVRLSKPTSADLAKLAEARGVPASDVTVSIYPAEVEGFLWERFGSGLIVQRTYVDPVTIDSATATD